MNNRLYLFILALATVRALEFQVELDENSRSCFKEFLSEGSAYRFEVEALSSEKYELSILFSNGKVIYKNPRDEIKKKIDSFPGASGQYSFCLENLSQKQFFSVKLYKGIQVSDSQFFPKEEDSKQINKQVDALKNVYDDIRKREQYSMTVNEYNMELQKLVSFKSVGFGFLSITVVLIISFLHYLEIKRVLKNRKII